MIAEAAGVVVHGCRAYATPHLGRLRVRAAFECTVSGRLASWGDASRALVPLVERLLGVGRLAVAELRSEGLARGFYVVNKAWLRGAGVEVEVRLVTLGDGRPLVMAGALREGLEPPPGWSRELGSHIEGPLAPAKPLARPRALQTAVPSPAVYIAEGEAPEHPGSLRVVAPEGVVRVEVADLLERAEWLELEFHCVTGWSLGRRRWLAVRLRDLVKLPGTCWLLAVSSSGYSASIPCSVADEVYLALGYEGSRLARERGGPVRLLAPPLFGWKHVKWLAELRVTAGYVDGYWEALGYHERGLVDMEERFKVRNPELETVGI